jgi:phage-related protein
VEFGDCTINLDTNRTPLLHFLGPEISSRYNLDVVIENTTTGEQMRIQFPMAVDETFVVDTDKKLVYFAADGSNQFQAMSLPDTIRRDWLKLQPGSNTLKYNEAGVSTATVTVEWVERFYD